MGRPLDTEIIDKQDFIKAAPEQPEEMFAYIEKVANGTKDADLKKLLIKILSDNKPRLMYYPAAAKNHHAIFAGLLYHMKRMLMLAEKMTEVYPILDRDILLTGVIIHDIEKLNEMDSDENGTVSAYTFEGTMLGHLVGGVAQLETLCTELDIPYEKKVMLQHMVISHHYEPEYGSPKKPLFPEAEALHYLDMFDSKMYDFEDALQGVAPGKFSDRVWTLDNRKVYKREFGGSDR
jgi:3'-5' exoribonuclease